MKIKGTAEGMSFSQRGTSIKASTRQANHMERVFTPGQTGRSTMESGPEVLNKGTESGRASKMNRTLDSGSTTKLKDMEFTSGVTETGMRVNGTATCGTAAALIFLRTETVTLDNTSTESLKAQGSTSGPTDLFTRESS